MRQRATRMSGNGRAPAALAARVAALMASFSGPKLWLDPWDVSTLQQDSTGATPVTAAGDPIGRIMDKSGAANHATQATTTSRPLWQTAYAAFDGVDDSWATANIDFTSTDKLTVIAGVGKQTDVATGGGGSVITEFTALATNPGSFALYGSWTSVAAGGPGFGASSNGSARSTAFTSGAVTAAPYIGVATVIADIAAPILSLRSNGAQVASSVATQGAGKYANAPLYIGRRGGTTLPFNGNLYGLIIIGRLLSPDELLLCERYMAQQAGIVLP